MGINEILETSYNMARQTMHGEAIELYHAVIETPKGDIVEIGSACGGTTYILIQAALKTGKKVISIDPYPVEYEGNANNYTPGLMTDFRAKFKENILDKGFKNIIQYNQNLTDCIDKIPNDLSVVFIDGCHEFSFVEREYELLYPKICKGGRLYIHDINWSQGQLSKVEGTGVNEAMKYGKTIIGSMLKIVK